MYNYCNAKIKTGENKGNKCSNKLTEKNRYEIEIENNIYHFCGKHKNINKYSDIFVYGKEEIETDLTILFNKKINIDKNNDNNILENKNKCYICLDNYVNPAITKCCDIIFCSICILSWIEHINICPSCKNKNVSIKYIKQV